MLKHKICEDGKICFWKEEMVPKEIWWCGSTKELIELGREIESAKFNYCKKFKCRLDAPECF